MTAILKWVGREKSRNLEQALDRLLQPVPAGTKREDARKLIQSATNSYIFNEPLEKCQKRQCDCVEMSWPIADIIKDKFVKGSLPSWCLDIIRNHHFYFQSQVEDSELLSSVSMCRPILAKIAWNLLQNDEINVTITARNDDKKLSNIKIVPEQKFALTNEDHFFKF